MVCSEKQEAPRSLEFHSGGRKIFLTCTPFILNILWNNNSDWNYKIQYENEYAIY